MSDITQQFLTLPTTCISDAMQGLTNMDVRIKPLKGHYKLAGRCFTVQMVKGDNLVVLKAIREAIPNEILVIDAQGDTHYAIAGDFILGMAQTLGFQGLITDGVIRDIEATKNLDFPVFCQGTTMAASGKEGRGSLQVPISCGGVSVRPGDIIVGDSDGVVVVPQKNEKEILMKAMKKLEADQNREQHVSGNVANIKKYLDDFLMKK